MDIDKEGEPGDACPGLFGIPCPIVSPSLLGPKSAEEHADGHKRETHIHEIVKHVPDILVVAFGLDKKQIESHGKGCTEEGVAEHIDNDMGSKPRALQSRHQRGVVDLWFEEIDTDEDERKDGRKGEYPAILPSTPSNDACYGKEEGVPEACLAHGAQGRTFEANPKTADEGEEESDTEQCEKVRTAPASIMYMPA